MSARLTRPPTGKSNASFSARPREECSSSGRPLSARSPRLVPVSSVRGAYTQSAQGTRPSSARSVQVHFTVLWCQTQLASVCGEKSFRSLRFQGPETTSARSDASSTVTLKIDWLTPRLNRCLFFLKECVLINEIEGL